MINDSLFPKPLIVDIFKVDGTKEHTYDLPFYYVGQFIYTNVKYTSNFKQQKALGSENGYQHLWNEGEAKHAGMMQFSWLSGNRYYSVSSAADSQTTIYHARIGANDPNINLRREPAVIVRKKSQSTVFASVIEPHGLWDGTIEISRNANSAVKNISVVASTAEGTVVIIELTNSTVWTVMVANGEPSETASHTITAGGQTYTWVGNYTIKK